MRFSRKIPTFVFGLSIGLLVGVGFFVFKINDLFNKMKDSAKSQITVVEQPVKTEDKEQEDNRKNKERFKINLGKSDKVNYSEVDSLIRDNSEINVATEELLSVKNVKIIHINPAENENDSLAADIAGVKEKNSDLYFIEFWKTPLNSKGYRFSKNKVLLYGFLDFNNVSLYELDNSYYIKSSDQVYKLFYGADFKSLERVIDSGLLAKIN
ncbi:MAG: hypothetical protein H0W73_10335 [Bacteroidetes bacterium]|nr:hypothetical protein [Bacteroidota bacterium]